MLLTTLQRTGQPPSTKNYLAQNVSSAKADAEKEQAFGLSWFHKLERRKLVCPHQQHFTKQVSLGIFQREGYMEQAKNTDWFIFKLALVLIHWIWLMPIL